MKEELIDFLRWYHSAGNDTSNTTFEEDVDNYLKSINCPMEKPRTLGENEAQEEVSFSCNCTWPVCKNLSNCSRIDAC